MRKLALLALCLFFASTGAAYADDPLAFVSGGSTGKIYAVDANSATVIFSATSALSSSE